MNMLRHSKRALLPSGMTALLLALPQASEAQTTRTFTACWVPEVGAVYMIAEPGLPSACLSEAHEQFSWTEGESGGIELADQSVTSAKLADAAVITDKLGDGAVTGAKLADAVVTGPKLADAAVGAAHIADGAIGADALADGAVTTDAILNGTISELDIADGAVTSAHIADNSILTTDIGTNTILGSDIAANAVGAFHIGPDQVGASEIATSAVGAEEIASGAVGASEIATNAVGSTHIAANAVGPSELNVSYTRVVTPFDVPAMSSLTATVSCAASEVFSAGFQPQVLGAVEVLSSYPSALNAWEIRFRNNSPLTVTVDVWRICVNVS